MPKIELSQRTFQELQDLAEPLVDTPETVIRRLIEAYGPDDGEASTRQQATDRRRRARKGEKTPNEAFYGPLVKVLRDAGGELDTKTAVNRVGELMRDEFTEMDLEPLKSGEVRWRNTVRFARNDLVKQGKLDDNSPFGVWRLSE